MTTRSRRIIARAVLLALAGAALHTGLASAAGFTADQAAEGKQLFESNCAQCHGFKLEGPDAPALAGADVMQNWDTAAGLFDFIHVAMPPSAPGKLGDENYVKIIAYIMSFNGAQPGNDPITTDEAKLAAISLPQETAAGAAGDPSAALDAGGAPATPAPAATASAAAAAPAAGAPTADAASSEAVPQAYTWGKQLPGGPAPAAAAPAPAAAAADPGVPQAFTWGKTLPGATK